MLIFKKKNKKNKTQNRAQKKKKKQNTKELTEYKWGKKKKPASWTDL